jgi:hypothetical protein
MDQQLATNNMHKLLDNMRVLAVQPHFRSFRLTSRGIFNTQKEKNTAAEKPLFDLKKLPTDCLRLIARYLQTPAAAAVSECAFEFFALMPGRETALFQNSQGAFLLAPRWSNVGTRGNGVYCYPGYFEKVYKSHVNRFTQARKRPFLIDELTKNNETIKKGEKPKPKPGPVKSVAVKPKPVSAKPVRVTEEPEPLPARKERPAAKPASRRRRKVVTYETDSESESESESDDEPQKPVFGRRFGGGGSSAFQSVFSS